MKKYFQFLVGLFLKVTLSFSQNNFDPFKLDGIEWFEIEARMNGATVGGSDFYCNFYKICGDTVHAGTVYKRVFYGSELYYYVANGCPPWSCIKPTSPSSFSFYCFFRQDTLTKSNYYKRPGWNSDSLLCSYNLSVGDTVKSGFYAYTYRGMCSGYSPIVTQTDSILVEGKKFKIYYTDNCPTVNYHPSYCGNNYNKMFLIEGLGSSSGFLYWYGPPAEYSWNNVDSMSYQGNCNTVAIKTTQENAALTICPNPSNGIFFIEEGTNEKQTLRIFDCNGEVVLIQSIKGKTRIDASNLCAGVYNVNITEGSRVFNKRFVISK